MAATTAAATLAYASLSCAAPPTGTLDPGGVGEPVVTGMRQSSDGRPIAFGGTLTNQSDTHSVAMLSITLIEPDGVDLVAAYTTSLDKQVPVGAPIPPALGDETDPVAAREVVDNWAVRVPFDQTTLAPEDSVAWVLVVRPTTTDACPYAKGFVLRYREFGHDLTVVSNMAMILYKDGSVDMCQDVTDYLMTNPIK